MLAKIFELFSKILKNLRLFSIISFFSFLKVIKAIWHFIGKFYDGYLPKGVIYLYLPVYLRDDKTIKFVYLKKAKRDNEN